MFKREFIKQRILRCRKMTHHEEETSLSNDESINSHNRVFQQILLSDVQAPLRANLAVE